MVIDAGEAVHVVLGRLKKLPAGGRLELLTWKRDRSLVFVRQADGRVLVEERGFRNQEYTVEPGRLRKLLRTLLKREFPRSRRIRVLVHGLGP